MFWTPVNTTCENGLSTWIVNIGSVDCGQAPAIMGLILDTDVVHRP